MEEYKGRGLTLATGTMKASIKDLIDAAKSDHPTGIRDVLSKEEDEQVSYVTKDRQIYIIQTNKHFLGVEALSKAHKHVKEYSEGLNVLLDLDGRVFTSSKFGGDEICMFEVVQGFFLREGVELEVKPGSFVRFNGHLPDKFLPERVNIEYVRFPTVTELGVYLMEETV